VVPTVTRVVLTIDTATAAVTAGLVRLGSGTPGTVDVLAECVTVDARAHAECLTPNVLATLAESGLTMGGLQAVVVGCGPGPFTGLRVGMASAAAYGQALDIPVYGVCSLDAIGAQTTGDVLVVTDARRREVYWARYRDGVRVQGPAVNAPADVAVGTATVVAGAVEQAALFALPAVGPVAPSPAGLVAAVADWDTEPEPLVPLYLRRPDAKTLAERQAAS
jgi:tRNA threonylcarbamoyl adenosine modification protein YeaZ